LTTSAKPVFYSPAHIYYEVKTPDLRPRTMELDVGYASKLLGVSLTPADVKRLLEKMRYGVSEGKKIVVSIPPYRTDVLHPIDLVEDIAIAYGYDRFLPEDFKGYRIGERDRLELFSAKLRDLLVGAGFQEVMTLVLTNTANLFSMMNVPAEEVVLAGNPVTAEHSVGRNWLLPSLFSVLEKNKTQEYPQRIFEIGDCLTAKGETVRRLSGVIAHSTANFSEVKAVVDGLIETMGLKYPPQASSHASFISGRCINTGFGFYGEISPVVLENFRLEVPVAAFELDADLIVKSIYK
jgi:phenylalanyl-tRNA synthetase beta chain